MKVAQPPNQREEHGCKQEKTMTITCFKKAGRQVQPTKLLLMRFVAHRTLTMVEPGLVGRLVGGWVQLG